LWRLTKKELDVPVNKDKEARWRGKKGGNRKRSSPKSLEGRGQGPNPLKSRGQPPPISGKSKPVLREKKDALRDRQGKKIGNHYLS